MARGNGWRNGRPPDAPKEIRRRWPGITYPDWSYLQARCWPKGVEVSRCFAYSTYGGDVLATHEAAQRFLNKWRLPRNHKQSSTRGYIFASGESARSNTGIAGVSFTQSYERRYGIYRYAYSVCLGGCETKSFGCGNENTWTQARDDEAFRAACDLRARVETEKLRKRPEQPLARRRRRA